MGIWRVSLLSKDFMPICLNVWAGREMLRHCKTAANQEK